MQIRKFIAPVIATAFAFGSQGFAHAAADCNWTATIIKPDGAVDTLQLTVNGLCQEPTTGYTLTLTRVDLPGTDATTVTLVLSVVAPTGIVAQHVTPTAVQYKQTLLVTMPRPTKVTVFGAAEIINVN